MLFKMLKSGKAPEIFIILIVFCGLISGSVFAAGGDALEKYREQFRSYREARNSFELAREKYMKLGTLAARDEAFSATQEFLKGGIGVLTNYLEMLGLRVENHANSPRNLEALAKSLVAEDRADYKSLREHVESSRTLARLAVISKKLDAAYEEKETHAQFLNAVLILADLRGLQRIISLTAAEVKLTVQKDFDYPGRERILGEWYEKITNKLEESNRVLNASTEKLAGFGEVEKLGDRKTLVEDALTQAETCKVLSLEVVRHLLEIVRAKKY